MATTYLQAVNSVLRRLREREVSSVATSKYSQLIGDFVNDTIREVEARWDWTALRGTVVLSTVADTFRYTFQDVGTSAKLMYDQHGRPSVYNDTLDYFLQKAPSARWMSARLNANDATSNQPSFFDFVAVIDGEFTVDLWPTPDKVYSILFDMIIHQGEITGDHTIIKVPAQPVILGAWSKAIYERGEDQGYISDLAYKRYEDALADAIAYDMMNSSDNSTWGVV